MATYFCLSIDHLQANVHRYKVCNDCTFNCVGWPEVCLKKDRNMLP